MIDRFGRKSAETMEMGSAFETKRTGEKELGSTVEAEQQDIVCHVQGFSKRLESPRSR